MLLPPRRRDNGRRQASVCRGLGDFRYRDRPPNSAKRVAVDLQAFGTKGVGVQQKQQLLRQSGLEGCDAFAEACE